MIKPTVGRVVLFWPPATAPRIGEPWSITTKRWHGDPEPRRWATYDRSQPFKADVVYVHRDELINLSVFDHAGLHWSFEYVQLWQGEGERPAERFAEWMPYQLGQAAAAEKGKS